MSNSTVSVIIPTYNRQALLGRALDSVFQQTVPAFEVIVIDDGSTDGTPDLLAQYQARYPKQLVVIRQENRGESAARNAGITRARGEYIAFQDSDDVWAADKLEKQLAYMEQNPQFALVYTDVSIYTDNVLKCRARLHDEGYKFFGEGRVFKNLLQECFILVPAVLARAESLRQVGKFDESLFCAQDYDLWLRVAARFRIGYIDEPLVACHYHGSNITKNASLRCESFVRLFERLAAEARDCPDTLTVIRRRLSRGYADLAYCRWDQGDLRAARHYYGRALHVDSMNIRAILYWMLCWIPPGVVMALRRFKQKSACLISKKKSHP